MGKSYNETIEVFVGATVHKLGVEILQYFLGTGTDQPVYQL